MDDTDLGISLMVKNIPDNFPQIYSWLDLQKSNEMVVIIIMLVVGVINIVAMMLILLLQNIYQIGVLTILGMKQRAIRRVFIRRSLRIILKAFAAGNVISLVLLFL
ncbi:MAG: FtsX-like permease family protein, partial [Rikenellaceae bacterium]